MNNNLLVRRLGSHLKKRRKKQFLLVLFLMFIASFAEILSVSAVIPFLGVITNPEDLMKNESLQPILGYFNIISSGQLVLPVTIIFIIASLLAGLIRLILLYATTRLSYGIGHDISIDVYNKTLHQDYAIHISRNSSEVINGIVTKTSTVISGVLTPVLTLISSFIILIGIVGVLAFINFFVAFVAFVGFGLLYGIVIFYTRSKIRSNSEVIATKSNKVLKSLQEGLMGIRDVLIHGSQDFYSKIYRDADLPLRRAAGNNLFISGSPRFIMEAIGMILIASIAYFMTQNYDNSSSFPILGALALGAQRLLPIMQQGYGSYSAIKGSRASLVDVLELLDQPMPDLTNESSVGLIEFRNKISLRGISFRYHKDENLILDEIDLSITKGSRVGFVGSTGSGKSTLFDIFMGLIKPSNGYIEIDDQRLEKSNMRSWQKHIAHVPQDIYLSDNSILENIAFGVSKDKIDIKKVILAAKKAQIHHLIEGWEYGYDTFVGEQGIRLSGGQKQRIGIARALYKEADVLILDEATSALDSDTEESVVRSIEGLDRTLTILIIAHRTSTLKNCDFIVKIDKKKAFITSYDDLKDKSN